MSETPGDEQQSQSAPRLITARGRGEGRRKKGQRNLPPVADTSVPHIVSLDATPITPPSDSRTLTATSIIEQGKKSIVAIQQQLASELTPQSLRQIVLNEMQGVGMNPIKDIVATLQTLDGTERFNALVKTLNLLGLTAEQLSVEKQSQDMTKQLAHGGKLVVNILKFGDSSPVLSRAIRNISSDVEQLSTLGATNMDMINLKEASGQKESRNIPTEDGMKKTPNGETDYSEFLSGVPQTHSAKDNITGGKGR